MSPDAVAAWAFVFLGIAAVLVGLIGFGRGWGGSHPGAGVKVGPITFTSIAQPIALAIVGLVVLAVAGGYVAQRGDDGDGSVASDQRIDVPNVYNLPRARGLLLLERSGFTQVRTAHVCSNSVSAENIREIVLDNDPSDVSDETSIVNQQGAVISRLDADTPLLVKLSNGQPC